MSTNITASELGRGLYHAVWQLISQNFFDTARLADWDSYEHRFDAEIVDEESAMRCIDAMLKSLNDEFTWGERVSIPAFDATIGASADTTVVENVPADSAQPIAPPAAATSAAEEPAPVMAVLRPDGIGYIAIRTLDHPNILGLIEAGVEKIAACEGVILDLRNNVGGDVQVTAAACGLFLEEGLVTTMEMRHASGGIHRTQYALSADKFFANELSPDGSSTCKRYLRSAPLLAGKPLVILINRRTMSAAELMTAALVQQGIPGAVLMVGNGPTPGKGIGQSNFTYLEGKYRVRVTRMRWYAPGGDWLGDFGQTVRNGIEPDVLVPEDRGMEGLQVAFKELRKMLEARAAA